VETAVTNEYADILLELQQAHDMVGTMKEHFQESVNSFRSELTEFKKKLLDEFTALSPEETRRRQAESAPGHLPPRSTLKLTKHDATVPQVCKTPYRKRTKPFVPKKLGVVLGQPINHLSPRAWQPQMIHNQNARYFPPF
jgi:hypothetical protein